MNRNSTKSFQNTHRHI